MHNCLRSRNRLLPNYYHVLGRVNAVARQLPPVALSTSAVFRSESDEEVKIARQWFVTFGPDTVPTSICELSFSRASGPGGQNVNKVNSKATLRVPLGSLLPLLPPLLHPNIKASRYCKLGSDSIVIQTDESRKQKENSHQCFVKLHEMIVAAAKLAIPGETSDAQHKRVKDLQKSANERRLKAKKFASSKKSSRKDAASRDG